MLLVYMVRASSLRRSLFVPHHPLMVSSQDLRRNLLLGLWNRENTWLAADNGSTLGIYF